MAKSGLLWAAVSYSVVGSDFHVHITAAMYPTGEVRREKINPIFLGAQECIEDGKVWMGEMGWTHQSGVSGGSSCWPCSSSPQLYKESEMFRKEGKEHLRTKESAKCSQMPKKSLGKKSLYLKRKIKVFSLV